MFQPDAGRIEVNDRDVTGWRTADAIKAGVGMVHQHFMLVPTLTVTAPTFADFEHPELHDGLEAMLATPTLTAEQRLRLFHYLRDTTADAYGGWSYATGQLAGGGQYAQRLVTMRHFDMAHAKGLARRILDPGVAESEEQQGAVV